MRIKLVASGATSFSSFPKSKDWWTVKNNDEVGTRLKLIFSFHIIFIFKVKRFVFLFHFSWPRKNFSFFPFMDYTFLGCRQYVDARINILMSIFDGLGPSNFCRKMGKTRPKREEMDGNVVHFPP